MRIALDTETTGLDLYHGDKPFMVQVCFEDGNQLWWEWDVDPLTREPKVIEEELNEIQSTLDSADEIVLQNPKFDYCALRTVMPNLRWDWGKVKDTLLAGHLLASNERHDLTTMALIYLGVDVQSYEDNVRKAVLAVRRFCMGRNPKYPDWMIARGGNPKMPSAKESSWKNDMWLPRAYALENNLPKGHEYWSVTEKYGNNDTETTLALYGRQLKLLREKRLVRLYQERLKLPGIVAAMEDQGVTFSQKRVKQRHKQYRKESVDYGKVCKTLASKKGIELTLPKSGNNKSLLLAVEALLPAKVNLPLTKKGNPSLSADTIEELLSTLTETSPASKFLTALVEKRKRDTAVSYLEGYQKYQLPLRVFKRGKRLRYVNWYVLHPSLNPTGSHTLRWSSKHPNEQNISKKDGFNLRYCFGPAPGREWWSIDAKNLELRIPAYVAQETEQINLFEKPDEPPYYGSNHLLVFDILWTEKLGLDTSDPKYLLKAKSKYKATHYQWTKNGNFAVQYGAVEESGTADRTYHQKGAQAKIQRRFAKSRVLNEKMIAVAEQRGYVETLPDKTVDPTRGYPLWCKRTKWGRIMPTTPLNYMVQGTAMWWMMKAMIRVQEYLDTLKGSYMIMQVHDELVFDFPKAKKRNLPKIRKIAQLMEQGGEDIGVPTPVSIEYHPVSWDTGVSVVT